MWFKQKVTITAIIKMHDILSDKMIVTFEGSVFSTEKSTFQYESTMPLGFLTCSFNLIRLTFYRSLWRKNNRSCQYSLMSISAINMINNAECVFCVNWICADQLEINLKKINVSASPEGTLEFYWHFMGMKSC